MILITRTKFLTMAGLLAQLCVLVCPASRADGLNITLETPIVGTAGQTIVVYGDITNTTNATPASTTINFESDSLTINNTAMSGSTDFYPNVFLGLEPESIAPGATLTDVDLFTLMIDPLAAAGTYGSNYYDLFGDNGSGEMVFSVTVLAAPEPGSLALLASGLLAGLLALRRTGPGR